MKKIGYRRYSGPAFTDSKNVRSKRGAYLEKRIAIIETLRQRGNQVSIINNGDDFSQYDLIIVEFGSLNYMFHRKDIDFSNEVLKSGKAVFILDDPDMMPKDLFGCKVWVNATNLQSCRHKWKGKEFEYFPVAGVQPFKLPTTKHNGKVVYYGGTSGGREKLLQKYLALIPDLEIYGHKKDYKFLTPKEPPEEDKRSDFYSDFMACLNVRDNLHKKLDWHTGRKYDALISGCPAIAEDVGMFDMVNKMKEPNFRLEFTRKQQEELQKQRTACLALFDAYGL